VVRGVLGWVSGIGHTVSAPASVSGFFRCLRFHPTYETRRGTPLDTQGRALGVFKAPTWRLDMHGQRTDKNADSAGLGRNRDTYLPFERRHASAGDQRQRPTLNVLDRVECPIAFVCVSAAGLLNGPARLRPRREWRGLDGAD